MNTCMARRGFLTLRDCGQPATQSCTTCQRAMCTEHLSSASGYQQCLDCFAKSEQSANVDVDDPSYSYRYRVGYYSSGYSPLYYGSYHDTYYDDLDVRSFDDDMNDNAVDDEDGGERAGFGDS